MRDTNIKKVDAILDIFDTLIDGNKLREIKPETLDYLFTEGLKELAPLEATTKDYQARLLEVKELVAHV